MAEITWIKLKTDMFDNDKIKLIEALPDADTIIVIWVKLLAAAGKANCNGYIMLTENIAMNEEEMATIFNRPINTVRLAMQTFKRYGMIEVEDEAFRIKNWEMHQNIDGMEKVKIQNAERAKKYRANQKAKKELPAPNNDGNVTRHVTVTESNATEREKERELDIDLEIDKEIDKEKERDKEQNTQSVTQSLIDNDFLTIKNFFDKTIRTSNFADHKKMDKLLELYLDPLLINEAIKVTADRGKSNMEYVKAILHNWRTEKGINTYAEWQMKEAHQDGSNQRSSAEDDARKSATRAENERRAKLAGL